MSASEVVGIESRDPEGGCYLVKAGSGSGSGCSGHCADEVGGFSPGAVEGPTSTSSTTHQPQHHFNVQESTLVISNSSTCTLKLQSSSGPFSSKKKNYTVQFNKETTKTTTSSQVQIKDNMAMEDMAMSPVNPGSNSNSGIVTIANDATSNDSLRGRPPDGSANPAPAAGGGGPVNANSQPVRSSSSSQPCIFCWCCCCSCSWIRRRCLSVKAPNGSLEVPEPIRDDELGSISATEVKSWGDAFERLMSSESGRKVFRSFLRHEYSEENILFWLACEDLKKERSPEMIEEKARVIYEDYVSILSPREVSLDSRVRDIINRNMIAPSQHTFDEAQLQIYTLMHRDSYPRFVNSPLYKNMLRTVGVEPESSTSS